MTAEGATPTNAVSVPPAPARPVRGAFQCTFDDFREANLGHGAAAVGGKRSPALWRQLLSFFLLAAGIAALVWAQGGSVPDGRVAPVPADDLPNGTERLARFFIALAPTVALFACFGFVAILGALRPQLAWSPRPRRGVAVVMMVLVIVATVVCLWGFPARLSGGHPPAYWPTRFEFGLALAVWVTAVLVLLAFNSINQRGGLRRRWELQPFLHRPYTIEATADGITLTEPRSSHWYGWDCFPGFKETANLLLLYVSPFGFWVIPKRAFAEPGQLQTFKAMVLSGVKHGTFLPSNAPGFPIEPAPSN